MPIVSIDPKLVKCLDLLKNSKKVDQKKSWLNPLGNGTAEIVIKIKRQAGVRHGVGTPDQLYMSLCVMSCNGII